MVSLWGERLKPKHPKILSYPGSVSILLEHKPILDKGRSIREGRERIGGSGWRWG